MPQWLSNLWSSDSRVPQIAMVVGVVVALLVVYFIYRLVFGHRLRVPGSGRARQPRLGLVDAFSLDGQRQLVLVRRDNVEHLIMIGGPNDVVVESQILRSIAPMPVLPREAVPAKAAPVLPAAPAPATVTSAPPPTRAEKPTSAPQPSASVPAPTPPPPGRVLKPAEPTIEAMPRRPDAQPNRTVPTIRVEPAPPSVPPPIPAKAEPPVSVAVKTEPPAAQTPRPPMAPPRPLAQPIVRPPLPPPIGAAARTRATPVSPPLEPQVAAPAKPTPVVGMLPEASVASSKAPTFPTQTPVSAPPPANPAKPSDAFADLESLEAEMARLLGRDP